MGKDKQYVKSATSDMFTAMMWSEPKNEPLLLSYINGVFENVGKLPIVSATVMNPFNVKQYAVSKQIVLDVRVKDEWGRLFDIEMQNRDHPAFCNRLLYNWSNTYVSLLGPGSKHIELRPVISIIMTGFNIFPQLKNIHSVFRVRADENPDVLLTEDLEIHVLRLAKMSKRRIDMLESIRSEFLRHWLHFFAYGDKLTEAQMSSITDNDPAILSALEQLDRFYADPELRELDRQRRLGLFDQIAANEAEAKGQAKSIITFLHRKFQNIPQNIEFKLLALRDIEQLDRLSGLAYDCTTLDDFSSHLR
jgi:predicted transposase/invertase (TIGR01784 family)